MDDQWDYTGDVGDFLRDSRGTSYLLRKVEQSLFLQWVAFSPPGFTVLHDRIHAEVEIILSKQEEDTGHLRMQENALGSLSSFHHRLLASFGLQERAEYGVGQGSARPTGCLDTTESALALKCPVRMSRNFAILSVCKYGSTSGLSLVYLVIENHRIGLHLCGEGPKMQF